MKLQEIKTTRRTRAEAGLRRRISGSRRASATRAAEIMRMPANHGLSCPRPETAQTAPPVAHNGEARECKTLPPPVEEVLRGSGQPLAAPVRRYFEPRLGHDLSAVRVHRGSSAAEAATALSARAFTSGSHVVFGEGAYSPESATGRHLLAHELTHTIQQSNRRLSHPRHFVLTAENSIYERESDTVAAAVTRGRWASSRKMGRVRDGDPMATEGISRHEPRFAITPATDTLISRIRIRDCRATATPPQDPAEVQAAHDRALAMLAHATHLSNSPSPTSAVVAAAQDFFGITIPPTTFVDRHLWDRVLHNLGRMVPKHDQTYQCGPQSGRLCSQSGTYAWTVFRIHLCHPWWTTHSALDERAARLLHEWVHASRIMWSRRRDVYCHQAGYASLPTRRRVDLPDAYMQYIYRLNSGTDFCP